MKRKQSRSILARTDGSRAARPAEATTFRLPTVAALAAALALTAATCPASAIVGTADTGTEDASDDDAGDADPEAVDALSCPPPLGGVPAQVHPRVHGGGCGCTSEGNESGMAALIASAAVATAFAGRRRRG